MRELVCRLCIIIHLQMYSGVHVSLNILDEKAITSEILHQFLKSYIEGRKTLQA